MEVASARAKLVDFAEEGASPALATLPRREVEEALRYEDGPPELILDVTRWADGNEQAGQVSVAWERGDLEELLRKSEGDSVTIAFDPDALLQAFEADVEAHGLREAAAVLAVAIVAGGAATAGAAYAQSDQSTGVGGAAAIEQVRSDAGAAPGAAIEQLRATGGAETIAASAPGPVGADIEAVRSQEAATTQASLASADIEGVRSVQGPELAAATGGASLASSDIEGVRSVQGPELAAATGGASLASSDIEGVRSVQGPDLAAATGGAALSDEIEAARSTEIASGAGALTAADSVEAARSTEIAAGVASTQGASDIEAIRMASAEAARASEDTGGGISVSMPSPTTTGLVAGGIALLITGAAFAATRRQGMRPA
jgi:hypothetical protein